MGKADGWTRRDVMMGFGASALAMVSARGAYAAEYKQADATWLANCRFGISTHWTAQSQTVGADDWLPLEEAENRFSPAHYVDQMAGAGSEYVIFTTAHALQMLPAACAALPRRTTKRDLQGELADACSGRGLHLNLYYNHSCNQGDDPEWEHAVGYHDPDKAKLIANLLAILRELGTFDGSHVHGWWFDSCASLDPNDHDGWDRVPTGFRDFHFPWEEWVEAAKSGSEERLVTLSAGMLRHHIYSTHQEYEAGDANQAVAPPAAQFTTDRLQGHRWVCIDNPEWVHTKVMTPLAAPRYSLERLRDYVRTCNSVEVPVTFNVDIDPTGMIGAESLTLLGQMRS